MIDLVTPVLDTRMRGLCARAYPGHPRGCPNLGKRSACPPLAPLFADVYDLSQPVYAIYTRFDLGAHVAAMRAKHPAWTERQLYNCLYWQGTARVALREEIERFYQTVQTRGFHVTACPEAMGVNVTETMRGIGVELQWPPRDYTVHVALAGMRTHASTEQASGPLTLRLLDVI